MYSITFLPHTADIRLQVEAGNRQEIYAGALKGMNELMIKDFCSGPDLNFLEEELNISSSDETNLLVDFLSEVLTLSHINKALYCEAELSFPEAHRLSAKINGRPVTAFDEDIKAVTYHEAEIYKEAEGKWKARIIFDI